MTALYEKLTTLKHNFMAKELDGVIADAARGNLSHSDMIDRLVDLEIDGRMSCAIARRFRLSKLQSKCDIVDFDFDHDKSRRQLKGKITRLLDLDFIREGTNVVVIGNPGVGKTMLAKIIAWKACQANIRVLFTPAMNMLNQLVASQADHSLVRKLKTYTEPTLLLCDELGYLSLDQQTSNLLYQVISTRHADKRSTIITTNTAFSEWGNILFNTTIAAAIADRLVENSEVFLLGGRSWRVPNKGPVNP